MREIAKKIRSVIMAGALILMAFVPMMVSGVTWAAESKSEPPQTTILPEDWAKEGGIEKMLEFVLKFVVYGLGAAAVFGTVIAGVMYLTARDNEAQIAKAKNRLYEVVIGLVAWALMYAVLNWLIPGSLNF